MQVDWDEDVENHVKIHTEKRKDEQTWRKDKKQSSYMTTFRNSTAEKTAWRKRLNRKTIKYIEKSCQDVLYMLNYTL